jgi:hypothetical protein
MDQGQADKKIFQSKLEGSGRRGRPRLRWLEKKKVKRRRQKAVDKDNGRP